MLGKTMADALFPGGNPVGESIRIRNVPFVVIGVLESKGQTAMGQDQDDIILAPTNDRAVPTAGRTARRHPRRERAFGRRDGRRAGGSPEHPARGRTAFRTATTTTSPSAARPISPRWPTADDQDPDPASRSHRRRLAARRRHRHHEHHARVGDRADARDRHPAVHRRARGDVLTQFLTEAVVLSLAGGMIGIVLSFAASFFVNRFSSLNMIINPGTVVLVCFVCVGVGVFFGWYPARKAASLNPSRPCGTSEPGARVLSICPSLPRSTILRRVRMEERAVRSLSFIRRWGEELLAGGAADCSSRSAFRPFRRGFSPRSRSSRFSGTRSCGFRFARRSSPRRGRRKAEKNRSGGRTSSAGSSRGTCSASRFSPAPLLDPESHSRVGLSRRGLWAPRSCSSSRTFPATRRSSRSRSRSSRTVSERRPSRRRPRSGRSSSTRDRTGSSPSRGERSRTRSRSIRSRSRASPCTGPFGLSFVLVLLNVCAAWALFRPRRARDAFSRRRGVRRDRGGTSRSGAGPRSRVSTGRRPRSTETDGRRRHAAERRSRPQVRAVVPGYRFSCRWKRYAAIAARHGAGLIMFPETAAPVSFKATPQYLGLLESIARGDRIDILTGYVDHTTSEDEWIAHNAAALISKRRRARRATTTR